MNRALTKYVNEVAWRSALLSSLALTTLLLCLGCGQAEAIKTENPVQVEQNRVNYEEMARQERGG